MTVFVSSNEKLQVTLLLLPGSSMMTLASVLDPMRAANRIMNRQLFRWKIVTPGGKPADLTCGISIAPEAVLDNNLTGDVLFIIAGFNHHNVDKPQLIQIKQLCRRFRVIGGVESGSWILARCGLLDRKNATTHWEDLEDFALQFPRIQLKKDRFVIDGPIFTTGGASPTFDLMLHLIRSRYGYPLAMEVSGAFVYDGMHDAADSQPSLSLGMLQNREPRVAAAIRLMEQSIEEPKSISTIANRLKISVRMLEYLFMQILGLSPSAYYRRLRLQTAHRLVIDTRLRLQEIAIRTGFNSLPVFSRTFKQYYQYSPKKCRQQFAEMPEIKRNLDKSA